MRTLSPIDPISVPSLPIHKGPRAKQVDPVVPPIDLKRGRQPPGPAGEIPAAAAGARAAQVLEPAERLQRAQQHPGAGTRLVRSTR